MSRLVYRTVQVEAWNEGHPVLVRDGDHLHQITEILDEWKEMGDWWDGEGERTLLRVWTGNQEMFDMECTNGQWFIYRVWD